MLFYCSRRETTLLLCTFTTSALFNIKIGITKKIKTFECLREQRQGSWDINHPHPWLSSCNSILDSDSLNFCYDTNDIILRTLSRRSIFPAPAFYEPIKKCVRLENDQCRASSSDDAIMRPDVGGVKKELNWNPKTNFFALVDIIC